MTTARLDNGRLSLFDNPLFSDVLVKFSGQSIQAHKAILSRCSAYFEKAFTGSFQEAESPFIDLGDEDDPMHIRAMLLHIYNLDYAMDITNHGKAEELLFIAELFGVGDKYDVPELRFECVARFEQVALHRGTCIADRAFFDAMIHVLGHVYADKAPRHKTLQICCRELEDCVRAAGFDEVLDQVPGLAKWLLFDTFRTMDTTVLMQCNGCGAVVEHFRSLCPRCWVPAQNWIGFVWKKNEAGSDIPDHDVGRYW